MVEGLKELREVWYYVLQCFPHHCIRQQRPKSVVALFAIKEQTRDPDTPPAHMALCECVAWTGGQAWVCKCQVPCMCHAAEPGNCVCSLRTVSLHLHHIQAAKTAFIEKTGPGQHCGAVASPFRNSNRFVPQYLSSCNSETDRIMECAPDLLSSWSTGMWRYAIISQKALMGTVCLCDAMYVINLHCRAECGPVSYCHHMNAAPKMNPLVRQGLWSGIRNLLQVVCDNVFISFWLLPYGLQRPNLPEYLKSSFLFPC